MRIWKKSLLMIVAILVLSVSTGLVYGMTVLNSALGTAKSTYNNFGSKDTSADIIKATKPLTFLLMGIDTGDASRGNSWEGNSDSMIVVTVNPKTETTTMMNLQRDTWTNIIDAQGKPAGLEGKLNSAYPSGYQDNKEAGAVQWAMSNISQQVGLDIDNYALINMDGLVKLVDAVGGIDVVNETGDDIYIYNTEPQYTAVVPPGPQHINGEQALVFARDRDTLPDGDYGRGAHQREVIAQVMKKILSLNNLSQYQKILDAVKGNFMTNVKINMSTLPSLLGYKNSFNKVVSIQYQGNGETVGDASVQLASQDTYLAFQNAMRQSVGKSTLSTIDPNINTLETFYGFADSYFLPSATVTQKGKKTTTYGISPNGHLVTLTPENTDNYVSTGGGTATSTPQEDSSAQTTDSLYPGY